MSCDDPNVFVGSKQVSYLQEIKSVVGIHKETGYEPINIEKVTIGDKELPSLCWSYDNKTCRLSIDSVFVTGTIRIYRKK